MIENTNTKQFYPGPILNNTLEITDFLFNDAEQIKIKHSKLNEEGVLIDIDLDYPIDYEVTKILPSDIDATEAALTASTGEVLLKNVNVLAGEKLTVYRVSQIIQDMDYPRTGAFPAASHEGALDYLTMQNQEQQEQINRALKIPNSVATFDAQMPTPLPARTLKINADGTGFELSEFDPDVALVTTEEFKNQAQQAAIEALASQNIATEQANIATEQATIATEQANIATEQATIATNKTSEVVTSGNDALSNIGTAKSEALTEIETLHSSSVDDITNLKNTSISNITTAKNNAITSITNQETTSKNNIINEGAAQVANVNSAGTTQINLAKEQVALATQQATIATNKTSEVVASGNTALNNIDTAKNNAITSITTQETTSKNNIINEGATQVGLVQQEGTARVEEILETGCIDVEYTAETSTLTFTGGGSVLLSNYYTKEETDYLIPTNNNQLINGAGYITADYHDSTKQDVITDLAAIRSGASKGATALQSYTETDPVYTADKPNIALKSEIPTKVSSFTNDSNYQTATDVASMIASIPQFSISIVDALPSSGQKMVLYLVPKTSASGDDIYDEYIWIEQTSSFEHLGSTAVDLSDYYSKTEADELLVDKQPKMAIVTTQNTYNDVKAFLEEGRTVYFNDSGTLLICASLPTATIFSFQSTYHGTNIYWAMCGMRADGTTVWQRGYTIVALKSELPTTTSQLTNDSGFVTQDALLEKTTETWTFTLEDGTTTTKTMVLGLNMDWSQVTALTIPEGNVEQVSVNGVVLWRKGPSQTFVEYIEFDGNSWINTGFTQQTCRIEFGVEFINHNNATQFMGFHVSNAGFWGIARKGAKEFHPTIRLNPYQYRDVIINFDATNTNASVLTLTIGDTTSSPLVGASVNPNTTYVMGGVKYGSNINYNNFMKVYYNRIYNANNELIQDLRPCLDPNNVACMYDMVTGTYFYNQGTGQFITGDIL